MGKGSEWGMDNVIVFCNKALVYPLNSTSSPIVTPSLVVYSQTCIHRRVDCFHTFCSIDCRRTASYLPFADNVIGLAWGFVSL